MFTTPGRDALLAATDTQVSHVGLIQSIAAWRTPTVTEANYTSYARVAVTFGAAGDTTPAYARKIANSGAVTFPKNTGVDQAVIGYGLYTADTNGTLIAIGLLETDQPIACTVLASSDVATAYAHGLTGGERGFIMAAPFGAVPDVYAESVAYYVITSTMTSDTFQLSSTGPAGAAVASTTNGAFMFLPYTSQTIAANSVPEFAIGQIIVEI